MRPEGEGGGGAAAGVGDLLSGGDLLPTAAQPCGRLIKSPTPSLECV